MSLLFKLSLSYRALRLELLGKVVEADPALAPLNVLKLLKDLLLRVASLLDNLPELLEFVEGDLAVVVGVDLVEKLTRRNLGESTLPVLERLVLVDGVAAVHVEAREHLLNLLCAFRGERCLQETK